MSYWIYFLFFTFYLCHNSGKPYFCSPKLKPYKSVQWVNEQCCRYKTLSLY